MSSLFTKIIAGEIPGRFLWSDDVAVAFLTIAPLTPGHALVVPRAEVCQWTEADDTLLEHLVRVAKRIGAAQQAEWDATRIGVLIEGFEVDHLHIHVWPAFSAADFDVHNVDHDPDPAALDESAERIRVRLIEDGFAEHVPADVSRPL
ncbi:MAG: HIT family protein [Nocardioidaceae bacterium]|jgi:histidine triad (HIT) family protein|nr:HIT family protein [Nocardioidaceae bacterium]